MLKIILGLLVGYTLVIPTYSSAALIDPSTYYSDASNSQYWTNIDLNLDVMRLSYGDFLNLDGSSSGGQADRASVLGFLGSQSEWRWAAGNEYNDLLKWFDTDPDKEGWSTGQNPGSLLFMELMGLGLDFFDQGNGGYARDGEAYWRTIGAPLGSTNGRLIWGEIRAYGDPATGVACNARCDKGWLETNSSTYQISQQADDYLLKDPLLNAAALLIRTHSASVPEPSTLSLMLLAGCAYWVRRRKHR